MREADLEEGQDWTGWHAIENLARHDTMNEYIQHTSSAIFAVPSGVPDGGYIGQALFEN